MTSNRVTIPARVLSGVRRQAIAAAPAECCGALIGVAAGRDVEVRMLIPAQNAAAEPTRYEITPASVLRLERQAACAGLQLVGFYHSHPPDAAANVAVTGEAADTARPSSTDLELACPGYVYMIVQVGAGAVRCWRLQPDRSGFAELRIDAPLPGAA